MGGFEPEDLMASNLGPNHRTIILGVLFSFCFIFINKTTRTHTLECHNFAHCHKHFQRHDRYRAPNFQIRRFPNKLYYFHPSQVRDFATRKTNYPRECTQTSIQPYCEVMHVLGMCGEFCLRDFCATL